MKIGDFSSIWVCPSDKSLWKYGLQSSWIYFTFWAAPNEPHVIHFLYKASRFNDEKHAAICNKESRCSLQINFIWFQFTILKWQYYILFLVIYLVCLFMF